MPGRLDRPRAPGVCLWEERRSASRVFGFLSIRAVGGQGEGGHPDRPGVSPSEILSVRTPVDRSHRCPSRAQPGDLPRSARLRGSGTTPPPGIGKRSRISTRRRLSPTRNPRRQRSSATSTIRDQRALTTNRRHSCMPQDVGSPARLATASSNNPGGHAGPAYRRISRRLHSRQD